MPPSRPSTVFDGAPRWATSSAVIGVKHTSAPTADQAAAVNYEANYARKFGVTTPEGRRAIGLQDEWLRRAKDLAERPMTTDAVRAKQDWGAVNYITTGRADGGDMATEAFDSVYSNRFTHMDTASAMLAGSCKSTIDPRRNLMRPKDLAYGTATTGQPAHLMQTAAGPRRVLPSRSTMSLYTTLDF